MNFCNFDSYTFDENISWQIIKNKLIFRLSKGISIIRSISTKKFQLLLSHIVSSKNEDAFSAEELKKLGESLKISNEDVVLLINSVKYIVKQSSKVILKPTTLEKQLKEHLKFDDDKTKVFMEVWCKEINADVGSFDDILNLDDLAWEQIVKVADQVSVEQQEPAARLQLNLSSTHNKKNITVELDKEELLQLYNTIEAIQMKLDNFNM